MSDAETGETGETGETAETAETGDTSPSTVSPSAVALVAGVVAMLGLLGAWFWADHLRKSAEYQSGVNGFYNAIAGAPLRDESVTASYVGPIVLAVACGLVLLCVGVYVAVRAATRPSTAQESSP